MLSLPTDALLFALASAVAFAALDLAQKWSARYAVPTPAAFLALRLASAAILSPLLLLLPGALTNKEVEYGPLIGLIVTNLLGNVLYLISVYRADISVVGSLWPLKNAYLPLLAWALPPNTVFPPLAYALILAATLGAVLVAYNGRLRIHSLTETPVALMAFLTVPVFAFSDYFLNRMVMKAGSPLATTLVAWALAGMAVPVVLAHQPSRQVVARSVRGGRGILGAALTGIFLIIGVACIGEAFKRGGASGFVLVNVYAMTSGVLLLLVNVLRPGWLEGEERGVYLIRIVGAVVLIAAAGGLRVLEVAARQH
jgi:hypothetical protein